MQEKENMQTFYGDRNNGLVDWELGSKTLESEVEVANLEQLVSNRKGSNLQYTQYNYEEQKPKKSFEGFKF